MALSDRQMTSLAETNPKELSRILTTPKTDIATLSFGIEILATECKDETIVLAPLKLLMRHIHAVVREGALTGVLAFYSNDKSPPDDILQRLQNISEHDPSPTLKELARDLLENWKTT